MALRQETERLRQEFLKLYTERDRMVNVERDDLYIRYVNLLGKDKYENFRLAVEVRALKLKTELAQAAINRNETPDADYIARRVDRQMADYYKSVAQQADAIRLAQQVETISSNDVAEMHQLFRLVVKRLHPDLHPDQPEKMADLFLQGQTAYRTHNLALLREIVMRLDLDGDIDSLLSRRETPKETLVRLRRQVDSIRNEIARLNASFPFNLRSSLLDPTWVRQQQTELKHERERLEQQRKIYVERFSLMTE